MNSTPLYTTLNTIDPGLNPGLAPLQEVDCSINWKPRAGKNGKVQKVPFNGARDIDPHDPSNHLSFQAALENTKKFGLGLGFVVTADHEFVCIDVDGCVDEHGQLNDEARGLIERFKTYAEYSPSGRGIHLWFTVSNKNSEPMREWLSHKRLGNLEIYGYKQFITITSAPVPGAAEDITDCTDALIELYRELETTAKATSSDKKLDWDAQPVTLKTPEEVLQSIDSSPKGKRFRDLHETGDAILAGFKADDDGKIDHSKVDAWYIHTVLDHADNDPRMAVALYEHSALRREKSEGKRGDQSYAEYSVERILSQRLAAQERDTIQLTSSMTTASTNDSSPTDTGVTTRVSTSSHAVWPEQPVPFSFGDEHVPSVPHMNPDELLPPVVALYVNDEAERLNVYPEAIAMPLIASLGIVVGCRIAIKPKAKDSWLEHTNLWGFVAAPPGSRKSEAIRSGFSFLFNLIGQAEQQFSGRITEHQVQLEQYKKQREQLAKEVGKCEKAIAKGQPEEQTLEQDLEQAQNALKALVKPEEPTEQRLMTQDATPEALLALAAENPNGILVYRDEISGIYANLGKAGRENERAIFLEGWDGKSGYRTDRITRNAKPVHRLAISVFGGTQPGVLRGHVQSAYGFGKGADGFLQRFQLAVVNDAAPTYRNVDCEPDLQAWNDLMHVFRVLNAPNLANFGIDEREKHPALRFDANAQPVFLDWLESNAQRIANLNQQRDEALANHFAKYPKLMAGLALLFHLAEVAQTVPVPGELVLTNREPSVRPEPPKGISLRALEYALKCGAFLEQHARIIYGMGNEGTNAGPDVLFRVLEFLDSDKFTASMTVRDVRRKLRHVKAEVLAEVLAELEEKGWLRIYSEKVGHGRPSTKIMLHPKYAKHVKAVLNSRRS
jgi:Protein of unknown function (DUF3987)